MPRGGEGRRRPDRRALRRALLAAIALLFVVSIPWYRDAGAPVRIWLGLPDWVAVALGAYALAAALNAAAWLMTEVEDPPAPGSETQAEPPR